MITRLVQKHPLKGTRTFEIIDDAVNVHMKSPFKREETLTVMLSVLNQEPVISKSCLEFTSRVNNEALLSLYLAKPNAEDFNAFVNLLKQKIHDEFSMFAGLKSASSSGIERNVFEEPPELDSPGSGPAAKTAKTISAERVGEAIRLLSAQLGREQIGSFIAALEGLQADPQSKDKLSNVIKEFHSLGPAQGAILTYAPYVMSLLSDDPFSF